MKVDATVDEKQNKGILGFGKGSRWLIKISATLDESEKEILLANAGKDDILGQYHVDGSNTEHLLMNITTRDLCKPTYEIQMSRSNSIGAENAKDELLLFYASISDIIKNYKGGSTSESYEF